MKRLLLKLIVLCLVAALTLCGCSAVAFGGLFESLRQFLGSSIYTSFDDMEYTRPDMEVFRQQLRDCLDSAEAETDAEDLMDKVYILYETYYDFYTNYALANIRYSMDLTDIYWSDEYNHCLENSAEVDAGMDQLLYALADSNLKEELEHEDYFGSGFFDEYTGDSLWDDAFTALMDEEARLQSEYYSLSTQALEEDYYSDSFFESTGTQMAELFVELVTVRQEIAAYAGYDNYLQFAYDFYYYRDYTPEQAMDYMDEIRSQLVELYVDMPDDVWAPMYTGYTEKGTFAYVENCAQAMGGTVEEAFYLLKDGGLYDISYSENKYDASFEVFLPSYYVPFVFVNPQGTGRDPLTFAHEFGHFASDYAAGGSIAGVDVAEVFSQGMEYLSLCYCQDTAELERMKMADSLSTFVEQSAYASFEHQVYLLEGDELTTANVQKLYEEVGTAFGFTTWGWDSRDYVLIPHFFTNPMYIISYVVSNDAALQIYQAEQAEDGAGLQLLEDNLATEESYFLAFVESAGLTSPFADGRITEIRATLEKILK